MLASHQERCPWRVGRPSRFVREKTTGHIPPLDHRSSLFVIQLSASDNALVIALLVYIAVRDIGRFNVSVQAVA